MGWLNGVLILYAILNIGGGIAGYVTKHSVPSIVSGVIAGVLVVVAAVMTTSNPKCAYIIALVVALGDLGFFGMKLIKGAGGFWPAGVMAAASVIVFVCCIMAIVGGKAP